MTIMVEFDNEGTYHQISSNFTKHQQAQMLGKGLGKTHFSYRFIYLNIEGISEEFLLEENKQD